jgi:hypothetical protein
MPEKGGWLYEIAGLINFKRGFIDTNESFNSHTRWWNTTDDKKCLTWVKAFHDEPQDFAKGVYMNFLGQEGEDRIKEAYTSDVWERLVAAKDKWDLENRFHINQNIKKLNKIRNNIGGRFLKFDRPFDLSI